MKWLVWILCAAGLMQLTHRRLRDVPMPQSHQLLETLPSTQALHFLSMGYKSLVADYYWLRAINEYGDILKHDYHYPNVAPLMERCLSLDPYFRTGYVFAGTALTTQGMDPAISNQLLEQGMLYRREEWRIPFLLGFNNYYFFHDYVKAARFFAKAATLSDVPDYVGPLATRLAVEAGEPAVGLQLVDSILESVHDPQTLKVYQERRKLLQLEIELRWLAEALDRYQNTMGKKARELPDLVAAGLLQNIPTDPLGGTYFIDPQGRIQTTSDAQRLRVYTGAKK